MVMKLELELFVRKNPGVAVAVVNWPTILPVSLMPKVVEEVDPEIKHVCTVPPLGRKKAFPFPSVPTTSPVMWIRAPSHGCFR